VSSSSKSCIMTMHSDIYSTDRLMQMSHVHPLRKPPKSIIKVQSDTRPVQIHFLASAICSTPNLPQPSSTSNSNPPPIDQHPRGVNYSYSQKLGKSAKPLKSQMTNWAFKFDEVFVQMKAEGKSLTEAECENIYESRRRYECHR